MTYALMHFLHDLGALGMAATFAIEAAGLYGLRHASSGDQARAWLATRRWLITAGPVSMGLVFITGFYAIIATWGWQPWLVMSLLGLVAIVLVGGAMTGVPMTRLEREVRATSGLLSEETRQHLHSSIIVVSLTTRVALTLGIVFLMVVKPGLPISTLALLLSAVLGVAAGVALAATPQLPPLVQK